MLKPPKMGDLIQRVATLQREKIDKANRKVPILISTETPIKRSCCGEVWEEVLLHGEENVDLSRVKNPKLLFRHDSWDLPIGRLENVRLENRELRADAVFSEANPKAETYWQMVLEGTLDEISVGGRVLETNTIEKDGKIERIEITKWEFLEASLVILGDDPNAGINREIEKGDDLRKNIEQIRRELDKLQKQQNKTPELEKQIARLQADLAIAEAEREKEKAIDLQRRMHIQNLALQHGLKIDDEFVTRFLEDSTKTEKDFAFALLNREMNKQERVSFMPSVTGGEIADKNELKRVFEDVLAISAGIKISEPHKDINRFIGIGLQDIARKLTGYTGYNINELIARAMSTDDFPLLLQSTANRVLEQGWEEEESTFQYWTEDEEFKDFRPKQIVTRKSINGVFERIYEGGEKKYITFEEDGYTWAIHSYGEQVVFTREMLINDDLGALTGFMREFGNKAKRTINLHVYDLLLKRGEYKNFKMGDGKPIFADEHKNIATANEVNPDSLEEAVKLMRSQKEDKIRYKIPPKFLIVGLNNEINAKKILGSDAAVDADQSGIVNPWKNSFKLVVENELEKEWFLAAARRTVKVGYLKGSGKKPQTMLVNKTLTGLTYEVVLDFGVTAADFRGLVKNPGK